MTFSSHTTIFKDLDKALNALFLVVDESVANDVSAKVKCALAAQSDLAIKAIEDLEAASTYQGGAEFNSKSVKSAITQALNPTLE